MDRLKAQVKEFIEEHKLKIILGLLIVIVSLMVILFVMMGQHGDDQNVTDPADTRSSLKTSVNDNGKTSASNHTNGNQTSQSRFQSTFIDIEGAVKRPGVYQFTNNMRVDDAVNLAGGLNRSADRKHIDLAKKLVDQQTVYIPIKGEIKGLPSGSSGGDNSIGSSSGSRGSSAGSNQDSGRVNLNSADDKQLESVNGIGEKRAEKIVDYRKDHGNFKQVSDLKNVSGIGDKFLANIKDHVTV